MKTVGELIRDARKKKGLSQDQLGAMVGLTRATVSGWERNKNPPLHKRHQQLSNILGLDIRAFSPPTAPHVNTEPDSVVRSTVIILEWSDLGLVPKSAEAPIRAPAARRRMGVDIGDPQLAPEDCFAARLTDNSMEPTFHAGERLVFNRRMAATAHDGDSVLVRMANGDHIFRHYKSRGKKAFDLVAENAEHFQTITINAKSHGEVIGVMVVHERKPRRNGAANNHSNNSRR
jgi:transcriptional regulator with XRE-family HTH domain